VGDVGHYGALRRHHRVLGREDLINAEALHEPAFLVLGLVAGAGHGTGMPHGSRQLRLPTADDASDDRLAECDSTLVVAAGLGIRHRGLAANVVVEGVRKVPCRVLAYAGVTARTQRM